ncbi:MAG: hypothetical protein PHU33_14935 [Bacteroidales bacterium]|nr:hypothetical protein [Bacteroidales bacterium]
MFNNPFTAISYEGYAKQMYKKLALQLGRQQIRPMMFRFSRTDDGSFWGNQISIWWMLGIGSCQILEAVEERGAFLELVYGINCLNLQLLVIHSK